MKDWKVQQILIGTRGIQTSIEHTTNSYGRISVSLSPFYLLFFRKFLSRLYIYGKWNDACIIRHPNITYRYT